VIDRKLTLRAPASVLEPEMIVQGILQALDEVGLRLLHDYRRRWEPKGLTWCGWGRDFRLVVHTWPEKELATIDFFGASDESIAALELALGWRRIEEAEISRGNLDRARTAPCGDA
jgi:S-adenosylmethionine/arginine decarboxylase-like enzyme